MQGFKHLHDVLCPMCECETLFYWPNPTDLPKAKNDYLCLFCQMWYKKSSIDKEKKPVIKNGRMEKTTK